MYCSLSAIHTLVVLQDPAFRRHPGTLNPDLCDKSLAKEPDFNPDAVTQQSADPVGACDNVPVCPAWADRSAGRLLGKSMGG